MKTLYCAGCSTKVAMIETGSKLKKNMVCLCGTCEKKRKASDLAAKTGSKSSFDNMFDGWHK